MKPVRRGFTLIEMLVTVALVAIIATMATPMVQLVAIRNKEMELKINLREIRNSIDAYKRASDEGRIQRSALATGYPPTLDDLVRGAFDMKDATGRKIFFLRRVPRDPFSDDTNLSAADTWGKRSYENEASDPKEGDDVYDIYSKSNLIGMNGIPYREW